MKRVGNFLSSIISGYIYRNKDEEKHTKFGEHF